MPAGLEIFNESNHYQIDSDFTNLALIRKGSGVSQRYTNGSVTMTRPSRIVVTLQPNEIIAFACLQPCGIAYRQGTNVYVHCDAEEGVLIEYWIFAAGSEQSSFGLQVFNEAGGLTFDSSWRLFNVRGLTTGLGNMQYFGTGKYAVVPMNVRVDAVYQVSLGGVTPNVFFIYSRATFYGSAICQNGNVSVSMAALDRYAFTRQPPGQTSGPTTVSNGIEPSYIVIDVTGY